MKYFGHCFLLFGVGFFLCCCGYKWWEFGHPIRLTEPVFERQLIDLSDIPLGKEKDVVFEVKNSESQRIVLKSIIAECSCTVVEKTLIGAVVEKGASISIPVQMSGLKNAGKFEKKILLRFDLNGKSVIAKLAIIGNCFEPLKFENSPLLITPESFDSDLFAFDVKVDMRSPEFLIERVFVSDKRFSAFCGARSSTGIIPVFLKRLEAVADERVDFDLTFLPEKRYPPPKLAVIYVKKRGKEIEKKH